MARPKSTVPTYCRHSPSNNARCWVNGRWVYLGKYDSPESRLRYAQILANISLPVPSLRQIDVVEQGSAETTLDEVLLAFWRHAEQHYRRPDGSFTNELVEYKQVFRLVRSIYSRTPAAQFGPVALKTVRQKMIDKGLCRSTINNRIRRLKHVFKWAASEQLVPVTVYQLLATIPGLQKGRSQARESIPIQPVTDEQIEAVLPHVLPEIRAMICLQNLTGMRPGEVVAIRPIDIERKGPVWFYRPTVHKNVHLGKARVIALGPRAQEVLSEFSPQDESEYFFSPAKAMTNVERTRSANRKTPRFASHVARQLARKAPDNRRGDRYTSHSYAVAIRRACKKAKVSHWQPNQIRHTHGTSVRRRFGLEAAQVILGHQHASVTEIYAERNLSLAAEIAREIG